ncbi:hypothetical protein S245_037523, partial [Arachis hypogaea]
KKPLPWIDTHTRIVKQLKLSDKELPCLYLPVPQAFKIVETNASNLEYTVNLPKKFYNK